MKSRIEAACKEALKRWGSNLQIDMMIEESAELTKALLKFRRNGGSIPDYVLEEIADVSLMIEQMKILFGISAVEQFEIQKLERLEQMLREPLACK